MVRVLLANLHDCDLAASEGLVEVLIIVHTWRQKLSAGYEIERVVHDI